MPGPLHAQQQPADGIHTPVAFTYTTIAALNAASGFQSSDLYKFAFVTGNSSLWCLVQYSPAVWSEIRLGPAIPPLQLDILAGIVTTNTAWSGSYQSLGMIYFSSGTIGAISGTTEQYFFNAIVDCVSLDTNLSAAVDLYDYSGIVAFPPAEVPGSAMSSSSPNSVLLSANLTSVLSAVTGSGFFEARLWRTVSGSLGSTATCRNALLQVNFS